MPFNKHSFTRGLMEDVEGYTHVLAPAGELGISFDDAAVVLAVEPSSKIALQVGVGWCLMGVQSPEATSTKKDRPEDLIRILSEQAHCQRELLFRRPPDPTLIPDEQGHITVCAPPGPLGLQLSRDEGAEGCEVHSIKKGSPIAHSVRVGMLLLSVDGDDVTQMSPSDIAELLLKRKEQPERVLTLAQPYESPWPLRILFIVVLCAVLFISWVFYTIHLGNQAQERARLAQQRAEFVVGKLAGNAELDLSHDFLLKVVAPAIRGR